MFHLRMRARLMVILAVSAVAAAVLPRSASAASAAGLGVLECHRGSSADERQASFRAVARRVEGAQRMWIRLRLEERTPGTDWRSVDAPGLGVWRKSRPGVGRFAIRQRVLELAEGVTYRVVAGYRWYAADGTLLLHARRRSRSCRQQGDLPNLRVRRVVIGPLPGGPSGVVLYTVTVVNRGRAPAQASAIRLSVDGDVLDTVPVPALAPFETAGVQATGPACGFALVASADPTNVVRETDERDNSLSIPCAP